MSVEQGRFDVVDGEFKVGQPIAVNERNGWHELKDLGEINFTPAGFDNLCMMVEIAQDLMRSPGESKYILNDS